MSHIPAGDRIAGRYKVVSVLGSGGLGRVYLCEDMSTRKNVAIKVMRDDVDVPQEVIEQTKREATLLSGIQHRNIIRVLDFGQDHSGLFFIFEYIDGPTLARQLKSGPLDIQNFFHIAFQALEGLGAAHRRGCLHLDLKPANIMLHQYPSPQYTVKILDFGLAKLASEMTGVRQDELTIGSVYYISPEQLEHQPLGAFTDLYSLGFVFYHMLAGTVPFSDPDPVVVRMAHITQEPPDIRHYCDVCNDELAGWLHWLMQKAPEHRPQNCQEAVAALTKISMRYTSRMSAQILEEAAAEVSKEQRRISQRMTGLLSKILGSDKNQN
ncbi:MAG: serine/threonine protein kinase [Candidatus Methylacidiphilales bacterium]